MLRAGILGLPNVGKTTLFNALTEQSSEVANYPFATIETNVGVVSVPDERLEPLARLVKTQKIVPATVEFLDVAGLGRGASKGEGLGNQFLANIRETDTVVQVVRSFEDESVIHVEGSVDPARDIETIQIELALADLATAERRRDKAQKNLKGGDKQARAELAVLEKLLQTSASQSSNAETAITMIAATLLRSGSDANVQATLAIVADANRPARHAVGEPVAGAGRQGRGAARRPHGRDHGGGGVLHRGSPATGTARASK